MKEAQEKLLREQEEKRIQEAEEIEKLLASALKEEARDITKMEKEIEKIAPILPPPPEIKRHTALNVFYNTKLKKFIKVVIEYDLNTGYSKIVSADPVADHWGIALSMMHDEFAMKLAQKKETT
jgi:hypothetical protein